MVTVVDSPALSLSPSLPPASSSICVECSLRDDCLRTFRFCKHSKSPIFNRSMRTLNRFPIYLGEDMCDRINREALLKDILIFDKIFFDKECLYFKIINIYLQYIKTKLLLHLY